MVRKNEHTFEKVNITPTAVKVLSLLARSPGKAYYIREAASRAGVSVGGCHKVLTNLYRSGLVEKRASGKNVYYYTNGTNPALAHFKIFINVQEILGELSFLKERTYKIILFGSCARGEDTLESDIDIMIITESIAEVRKALINRAIANRLLRSIIMLPHQYVDLKQNDPALYGEVNKGIVLWRVEDEGIL